MTADTQWPRFQVLLQEREGGPYQDVGSVHAPDQEMALLNARDVFVRRPACSGLAVAPAAAIFSRTAEQLQAEPVQPEDKAGELHTYLVFNKTKQAGTQTLVDRLVAPSPEAALAQALAQWGEKKPAFAWWVIPEAAILHSDPADAPAFFTPALDKPFRLSTDFHTVSAMRQIMAEKPAGGSREP
jgi:ring-1,2-phenylacetyl-CoA epoxidase subunit PaaB